MKKLLIFVFCAVAVAGAGLWWFQKKSMPVFFAQDAVEVISYEASDLFGKDPGTTDDKLEQMIRSLHEASVINLKIDREGKAVDPFGTAFRVENRISANKSITTAVSAGPDCEFGTRDDISANHECSTDPQH